MKSLLRILLIGVVILIVAGGAWLAKDRLFPPAETNLLYGNVEIRQVDLAFNAEGIVTEMTRREGDKVKAGELLARLEDDTYSSALTYTEGRRDAARSQLDLLLAGTRFEEIDQARANLASAEADETHASAVLKRQQTLVRTDYASRQVFEDAQAAFQAAQAKRALTQAQLTEALNGPRIQEIDAARGQLRAAEGAVNLFKTLLGHTKLTAPSDGIIMTRVIEPGTTVLPSSPIYSMAITGEVWVRAFAPEPMLNRVAPGTHVQITSDADGGRVYHGHVGYVSPVAEFTPKTVETPELRTQLVYRLRIRVEDADEGVRQGMPVTIRLPAES